MCTENVESFCPSAQTLIGRKTNQSLYSLPSSPRQLATVTSLRPRPSKSLAA